MALKLTKETSEVIKIIKSISDEIKIRFAQINNDSSENFNMDVIKNAAKYSLDSALLNINEVIRDELEKLKWVDFVIDCGEIETDIKEIEDILQQSRKNINDELKNVEDFLPIEYVKERLSSIDRNKMSEEADRALESFKKALKAREEGKSQDFMRD